MAKSSLLSHYGELLKDVKQRISSAQVKAFRGLNRELIKLYWDIGQMIVERQFKYGWGKSIVERLSVDLRSELKAVCGYSVQNLWYMRQFYLEYKENSKLQQLVGEIPWGHNILIFSKVKSPAQREYYIVSSVNLGWSRNVLSHQIEGKAYEKHKIIPKLHNFPTALPAHLAEQADESMKSVYNLDFLGITRPVLERELERRLIEKIRQFIMELGYGFSFVGNQYPLSLGENEYFIDLLFFNRKLKCLVAIELKTGKFEPEYAGKMDFYLNLLNDKAKLENENPSIGIILCAQKDNIVVEYALRSVKNPVGVTEYSLTAKLPDKLKGAIPNERELKRRIKEELGRGQEL